MTPAPEFWWVTPLVGIIAAIVAFSAMFINRAIVRMRATLDLIERTESSEHYRNLYRNFKELRSNSQVLERLKMPTTEADKKLREQVVDYLNHYELVAIGCKHGILDEGFYASWMRSQLVRDWHSAKEFILYRRSPDGQDKAPALFIEFESMARRFETNTERQSRFYRFRGRAQFLLSKIRRR